MRDGAQAFGIRALEAEEIRSLYRERLTRDFPPNELKPLDMIERALRRDRYVCYGAIDGPAILAYAFFVKLVDVALVDYYAVREDLRDAGIGSRFIRALVDGPLRDMDCVLLEVEAPERAPDGRERQTRQRRLDFYLRNGLYETGVSAVVWQVPYRILALPVGARRTPEQVRRVYGDIYRSILAPTVYDEKVAID